MLEVRRPRGSYPPLCGLTATTPDSISAEGLWISRAWSALGPIRSRDFGSCHGGSLQRTGALLITSHLRVVSGLPLLWCPDVQASASDRVRNRQADGNRADRRSATAGPAGPCLVG